MSNAIYVVNPVEQRRKERKMSLLAWQRDVIYSLIAQIETKTNRMFHESHPEWDKLVQDDTASSHKCGFKPHVLSRWIKRLEDELQGLYNHSGLRE